MHSSSRLPCIFKVPSLINCDLTANASKVKCAFGFNFSSFSVAGSCLQPRAERWVLHRRLCNDATHAGARVHLGDDAHENQGRQVPCLVIKQCHSNFYTYLSWNMCRNYKLEHSKVLFPLRVKLLIYIDLKKRTCPSETSKNSPEMK